jgi:hypothetical protein
VTTYRKFYDEELDELLIQAVGATDVVKRAAGLACEVLRQDPDRLVLTFQGISGAMTIAEMQEMYGQRAAIFRAEAG